MNFIRHTSLRLSRRVKRFNVALVATLAAMALAACDAAPEPVMPVSSVAKGVQQILQSSGQPPLLSSQPTTGKQS
jgi:hypothetical protein